MDSSTAFALVLSVVGIGVGLAFLIKGLGSYRSAGVIADTATSRIATLAAGEVRVTGTVQPAELTLISLLQSQPCVYYRSSVGDDDDLGSALGDAGRVLEERSVGFELRDGSGAIRVFPGGARIDAPVRWEDSTGALGDEPPGLRWRMGSAFGPSDDDRAAAVEALLTVHAPAWTAGAMPIGSTGSSGGKRAYEEARIEPGDEITVIGQALPFSDLADPAAADLGGGFEGSLDHGDPEVAADLEAARAAGTPLLDPEAAWGNAAIPGFGIGQPVRAATIDPAADPLPIASAETAARVERTFAIAPETLVLASVADAPLLVTYGSPAAAEGRERWRFVQGLLGAVLAIGSLVAAALLIGAPAR